MSESNQVSVPREAIQVLEAFMEAAGRGDEKAMSAFVTRKTIEGGNLTATSPDMKLTMGQPTMEGEMVVIPVRGDAPGAPAGSPVMELPCLIVKEDGQWKFDLAGSVDRMLGGSLESMVGQLASTMATAMEGVGEAMAEGLKAAFGGETQPAASDEPKELPAPAEEKPAGGSS
ncbi:MAG: hypothetical protein PHU85_03720 [Phycisphaerae bacterium]|nr:hypothetical protein [Phycisphaerae bacterium]